MNTGGQETPGSAHAVFVRSAEEIGVEPGAFTDVEILDQLVIKIEKTPRTLTDAEQMKDALWAYHDALINESVPVAELLQVGFVPDGDRFRVWHSVRLLEGASLRQIDPGMTTFRNPMVREVIATVMGMRTLQDQPDDLMVGIDAHAANWRVDLDNGRSTLTDIWPPLLRGADGSFGVGNNPEMARYADRIMGTKSGAIAQLLLTAYHVARPAEGSNIVDVSAYVDEWRSLIPEGLHDQVAEAMKIYLWYRQIPNVGVDFLCAADVSQ